MPRPQWSWINCTLKHQLKKKLLNQPSQLIKVGFDERLILRIR